MDAVAIPLFCWSGRFVGFCVDGCLFEANGVYRGWEDAAGRVWHYDGQYLGERVEQHYVLRRVAWATPVPQPRRVPPVVPELPLPPPHRAARPPRPGWEDALGRFGLRPAALDLLGAWCIASERMRFLAAGRYEHQAAGQPPERGTWELRGNLYLTLDGAADLPSAPAVPPDAPAPGRLIFQVISYEGQRMTLRRVTTDRSLPFTLERCGAAPID
jgi:hypothetical protein